MIFNGTKRIETERLVLDKLKEDDYESIMKNIFENKEISKTYMLPIFNNEEQKKSFFNRLIHGYQNPKFYFWTIKIKNSNEVIGIINTVNIDDNKKEIEIGYCINPYHWNNGYATEACKNVIEFLLNETNAESIIAGYFEGNIASLKVMEKCQMTIIKNRFEIIKYNDSDHRVIYLEYKK